MQKRKSRKPTKKPRQEWVYARTVGEVSQIALQYDPRTGDVVFVTPVEGMYSEVAYERAKGDKVLTRTPLPGPVLHVRPDDALFNNYSSFVGVDTNTRSIRGQTISVTGIVLGTKTTDPTDGAPAVAYETPYCLEFVQVVGKPERVGWAMSLRQLREDGLLSGANRVALVVDSELSLLRAFNVREEPVVEGLLLPDGLEFVYASADSGGEYLANKLVRTADRASRKVLDYLAAGRAPLNENYIQGFPFKAFRIIRGKKQAG